MKKIVLICSSRLGAILGDLAFKWNQHFTSKFSHYLCHSYDANFRRFILENQHFFQKLVIFYATRAGANSGILKFKINVLCQELVNICATLAGENFDD